MTFLQLLLAVYVASFIIAFITLGYILRAAKDSVRTWLIENYGIAQKNADTILSVIKDFKPKAKLKYMFVASLTPVLNTKIILDFGLHSNEYTQWFCELTTKKLENKYHDRLLMIKQTIEDVDKNTEISKGE